MQPGHPGQDPYGQQQPQDPANPQYQDPYAQPPAAPYGQQPTSGQPYGQQPYQDPYAQQQQPYGAAPTYPSAGAQPQGQQNTLGLVSMILGIVSIPLICCLYLGIPVGIAAVITGYLARQKAAQGLASNDGQAKAGLICGAIGAGLGVVILILAVVANVNLPTEP